MKLSTYNILADELTDLQLRYGIPQKFLDRQHRTKCISSSIAKENSDVIALQEIDIQMFDDLLRECPSYTGHIAFHRNGKCQYGNAFLYRKELKARFYTFRFKHRSERVALAFSSENFYIVNVHLDIGTSGEQFEKMLQILPPKVIICGDFNALHGNAIIHDVCPRYGLKTHSVDWTCASMDEWIGIDYIATRGFDISSIVSNLTEQKLIPDNEYGSDHVMLTAEIS